MEISEFDFKLPKELIAKYPSKTRDVCRLMVLDRKRRSIEHRRFIDIVEYLNHKDLIVLNDTKVLPVRLFGKRRSGGKVEIFLLGIKGLLCEALIKPSNRVRTNERIRLESGDEVEIGEMGAIGRMVKFPREIEDVVNEVGHMPLPPYIRRPDEPSDRILYQTVFAKKPGATAAPTAALHFTESLLDRLNKKGIKIRYLTMHISYGTFTPIKTDKVEEHKMHAEYFELPRETIEAVYETMASKGRVIAVGTSTVRVLEDCLGTSDKKMEIENLKGFSDLYIFPGYRFKVIDGLVTNFHLPRSTLILLVSAFAGKDFIFAAYKEAIDMGYRFFSYGDAMLIL